MLITSPEILGQHIRNQRKEQKQSQAEVADRVGLKQATVSSFENHPKNTKIDTLFRVLAATNLEIHLIPRDSSLNPKGEKMEQEW